MRMLKMKYILFAAFLLLAVGVSEQKAERAYIRSHSNKSFRKPWSNMILPAK